MVHLGAADPLLVIEYLVGSLIVGLASGAIASFLLHSHLSLNWAALAGLLSTLLEPLIPIPYSPVLFGHSLLACIAGSAIILWVRAFAELIQRPLLQR